MENVKYYVSLKFETEQGEANETTIVDNLRSTFEISRESILPTIIAVICLTAGVIAIIIVVGIKKSKKVDTKKPKEPKKDIKIKAISKDELKKAKKVEKPKKQEKGKTEESEDLIFSVPQWEVEDED